MEKLKKHFVYKITIISFELLIFLIITGCASKGVLKQNSVSETNEFEHIPEVILGGGDVLNIRFPLTPELDETQTVRPDGIITLQYIGDVNVIGKTPSELKSELIELHVKANQIKNPDQIIVIVTSLYSQRVYIGGQVNNPGVINFSGRLTALEAIMEAGGFIKESAGIYKVLIIRLKNGRRYRYKLNLNHAFKGKKDQPFFLEPFDIVYVPENKPATLNRWINALLPRAIFSSTLSYIIFRELFAD